MARTFCLFLLGTGLLGQPLPAQPFLPGSSAVAEAMRRANGYWITNNSLGDSGWARGAYYAGNQRAFRVLDERTYHTWAVNWGSANSWQIGPEGAGNANAYACGQTYIDLYRMDLQPPLYLADIKSNADALVASPNVNGWTWIDAFYMQAPTLARLGNLTGDTNYFQKIWPMYDYMKTTLGLFDPASSLWYRDSTFTNSLDANGKKIFWSRGNGWVFAGLARVLQQMSTNLPHYPDYAAMFQTMAPAIKAVQGADGMWRSSLYDYNLYTNAETSGTGLFTHGLAWGVRSGLLPAAGYTNTIALAWQGLTNIALNANGFVGWVQNAGAAPAATTAGATTDFGVGAFLLACGEIYLLAPDAPAIRPWAGPDQTVPATNGGTATISLDGSQTEVYQGTAVSYTWWEGANNFASGTNAQASFGVGQHTISLHVLGSDGLTYTDSLSLGVFTNSTSSNPPAVLKLQFRFEDSGTTTTDSVSGISLNLVNAGGTATDLHGASGSGVSGRGKCLDFTSAASQGGTGPLASTVGNTNLNFGTVSNFTVAFWIKPASTLLIGGFPRFFSFGTNGTIDRAVANSLQLLSNGNLQSGSTAVQGFVNTAGTSTSGYGAFNMPAGTWSFLALAYDGTNLNFYGGSESNSVALMSTTGFPAGVVNLGNSWTLFLGNRLNGGSGSPQNRAFQGQFDDVRFYTGAADVNFLETVRQAALPDPTAGTATISPGTDVYTGTTVTLGAPVGGTPPFSYFWQTDGASGGSLTNIPGANSNNFALNTAVMPPGIYKFDLVVTNTSGSATSSVVALTVLPPPSPQTNALGVLIPVTDGTNIAASGYAYAGSSGINGIAHTCSALMTVSNQQFFAFYGRHQTDSNYAYNNTIWIARRTIGASTWDLFRTSFTPNDITDTHDVVVFGIDGSNYLHLSWGMHDQNLHYARSTTPVTGTQPIAFGPDLGTMTGTETSVTYPQFLTLPNGDLFFLYRVGSSGSGNTWLNRWLLSAQKWTNVNVIAGSPAPFIQAVWPSANYNAYPNMPCLDAAGHFHMVWTWRETPAYESNHDLNYARSLDGGVTWTRFDGTAYDLPICRGENGDTNSIAQIVVPIPQNYSLINQAGMCLDASNTPVVATWWAPGSGTGNYRRQYMVAFPDTNGVWQTRQVSNRTNDPAGTMELDGVVRDLGRPVVVADQQNRVIVLYRDNFGSNGLTVACSLPYAVDPQRTNWTTVDLTTDNLGNYEPVIDLARWQRDNVLDIIYQSSAGEGYPPPANTASPIGVFEWNAAAYFNHHPALQLALTNVNHDVALAWNAQAGWGYQVQWSTNLINWTVAATLNGTNGLPAMQYTQTNGATGPQRFWRLQVKEGGF